MTQRTDRLNELLRQEIGVIMARDIADPRIGFVTVTEVDSTADLSHAKVWVSIIGTADERKETLRALTHAMPFIRRALGPRIRIRRIPELHVVADETLERGTRVLQLLHDIGAGNAIGEHEPVEDSLPTPIARLPHEGDAPEPITDPDALSGAPSRTGPGGKPIRRRRSGGPTSKPGRRPTTRRRGGPG
ncbi:MAG: 30S ribosome-binding factor RbfA [Chloroflexota bacterium]